MTSHLDGDEQVFRDKDVIVPASRDADAEACLNPRRDTVRSANPIIRKPGWTGRVRDFVPPPTTQQHGGYSQAASSLPPQYWLEFTTTTGPLQKIPLQKINNDKMVMLESKATGSASTFRWSINVPVQVQLVAVRFGAQSIIVSQISLTELGVPLQLVYPQLQQQPQCDDDSMDMLSGDSIAPDTTPTTTAFFPPEPQPQPQPQPQQTEIFNRVIILNAPAFHCDANTGQMAIDTKEIRLGIPFHLIPPVLL